MGWLDPVNTIIEEVRKWRDRRHVMRVFLGEIHEVRQQLKADVMRAFAAGGQDQWFDDYRVYPRAIYQLSNLELLGDPVLSGEIVAFYTTLQQAEALGQQLRGQVFTPGKLADYLELAAKSLGRAIALEARLARKTRAPRNPTRDRDEKELATTVQTQALGRRTQDTLIRSDEPPAA